MSPQKVEQSNHVLSAPARAAAYVVVLVVVLVAALGVGRLVGPVDPVDSEPHPTHSDEHSEH